MENKYLVVGRDGSIHEPADYEKSAHCSEIMRACIEREVLGKPAVARGKCDYLKRAGKLGFSWEKNSSIGFLNYDYKADWLMRALKEYARSLVSKIGFPIFEVKGANFFDMKYPVVEAYAGLFGERLFKFKNDEEALVMSYDASYPQFNLAGKYRIKENQLPFAHFSLSDCYRYERSGECMLLFRGRRFFMPDLHPYFADLDSAWEWYYAIEKQIEAGFKLAGREYINVAKVSSIQNWEKYKDKIIEIAQCGNKEMLIEIKMDGQDRYWIVDIDYSFLDAFGQIREVGCIQIDVGNAKRLGIKYVDSSGHAQNPVIIHAAVPGGLERYVYMLLDDASEFPVALAPVQLRLIPVSEEYIKHAIRLAQFPNIRADVDDRNLSVGKRVLLAHKDMIPKVFVVGEREVKEAGEGGIPAELVKVVERVRRASESVPFVQAGWSGRVSRQVG